MDPTTGSLFPAADHDGEAELAPKPPHADYMMVLQRTPDLPLNAAAYRQRRRRAADPIGLAGMPSDRAGLNNLLINLCARLATAGEKELGGRDLAANLNLPGTRALRHLVAYGHVHHRLSEIVGVPGRGYVWGPANPEARETMVGHSRRMGRCWFFNAGLYGHKKPAVEAAQLMLDFADTAGNPEDADELHAWLASENVGIKQVLEAMIGLVADRDGGQDILRSIGEKHAAVLMPQATLDRIRRLTRDLDAELAGAGATCPGTGG